MAAEIELVVVDTAALERVALVCIDEMVFALDEDSEEAQEELRAAERDDVAGDPAAELSLLLDPDAAIDVDGVEVSGSECSVEEIEADGSRRLVLPDFAGTSTLMISAIREASESGALSADAAAALGVLIERRETIRVNGVWYAVTCEASWPTDLNVYYQQMRIFRERYPYGPGAIAAAPRHCTFSSSPTAEKLVRLKRSGYLAGLVVQAEFDPKTQYAGGPAMARRLSGRLLTVTDEGGHGMYGRNVCATK